MWRVLTWRHVVATLISIGSPGSKRLGKLFVRSGCMPVCAAWLRLASLRCMRYRQGYKAVIVPCVAHDAVALHTRVDDLDLHCQAAGLTVLQQICIDGLHSAAAIRVSCWILNCL